MNNKIMCIAIIVVSCVIIPILSLCVWFLPYKTLKRGFFRRRFGVLYEEIKFKKQINRCIPTLFFGRRIIILLVALIFEYG